MEKLDAIVTVANSFGVNRSFEAQVNLKWYRYCSQCAKLQVKQRVSRDSLAAVRMQLSTCNARVRPTVARVVRLQLPSCRRSGEVVRNWKLEHSTRKEQIFQPGTNRARTREVDFSALHALTGATGTLVATKALLLPVPALAVVAAEPAVTFALEIAVAAVSPAVSLDALDDRSCSQIATIKSRAKSCCLSKLSTLCGGT